MLEYYSGAKLYGDDFTPEQIAKWFEEEEDGYYNLALATYPNPQEEYLYKSLNKLLGYDLVKGQRFQKCLGIGVGGGQDVKDIAPQVDSFYCVEPAKNWWREDLFGVPSTFVSPKLDGSLDLEDASCDLAVSFGVLHHIPNVSATLEEITRVLKPGGIFILREPIVSMGTWGKQRPGLTKNERGLPLRWLREKTRDLGLEVIKEQPCTFRPFILFMRRLFNVTVYNSPLLTRADAFLAKATAFNYRYHRANFPDYFAPAAVFAVYRKR